MRHSRVQTMVEIALAIALAVVLGRLKIFQMPMGGSVSLGMLPVFVVALRRGWLPGILAGALYGVLDLMFDFYVVHPLQFLLDYPVAYGLIGLAGVFAVRWRAAYTAGAARRAAWTIVLPAVLVGSFARFAAHWVSGVVYFGEYAPAGQPVWLYSLVYNAPYVLVSGLLCAVCAMDRLPALERDVPTIAATGGLPATESELP